MQYLGTLSLAWQLHIAMQRTECNVGKKKKLLCKGQLKSKRDRATHVFGFRTCSHEEGCRQTPDLGPT